MLIRIRLYLHSFHNNVLYIFNSLFHLCICRVFTPQKYTLSNTKTKARAASQFSPLSSLPRLFAIQKSIILRKQCGNGENNAETLLSYNYFLRFSNQIFIDFWPQATPSIGRSVRLRETMKARYKAKVIHCKSAQIRAIRGEPPTQEAITPEFYGKIGSTLHKIIRFDGKIRRSGDTELVYVLDFLKMLWDGEIF